MSRRQGKLATVGADIHHCMHLAEALQRLDMFDAGGHALAHKRPPLGRHHEDTGKLVGLGGQIDDVVNAPTISIIMIDMVNTERLS